MYFNNFNNFNNNKTTNYIDWLSILSGDFYIQELEQSCAVYKEQIAVLEQVEVELVLS